MFHLATLKSKTFWVGLAAVGAGAYMCYTGDIDKGIMTIGGGLTAMTGSDRLTKILQSLNGK